MLVDPALKYGWVATVQTAKHLILGYVFRRTDYPRVQNWELSCERNIRRVHLPLAAGEVGDPQQLSDVLRP